MRNKTIKHSLEHNLELGKLYLYYFTNKVSLKVNFITLIER